MITVRKFLFFWLIALCTHAIGFGPYGIGPGGIGRPMHVDYSVRLRVARDWARGLKLYQETYENTQPTVFLFMRLVDSARPEVSHYFAETLLAAVGALTLHRALLGSVPACAAAAPILLVAWTGLAPTFYGGQITEAISLWFDVIALSCFALCLRTGRSALALASGISFFLMVSFRVPCLIHGLAYLPLVWALFRDRGIRSGSLLVLWFCAGVALPLLAVCIHALTLGYWEPYLEVLARNRQYAALDSVPLRGSLKAFFVNLGMMLGGYTGVPLLVWLTLTLLWPWWRFPLRGRRLWLVVGVTWLGAAFASVFPGGRHWPHYYHVAWAPLSILSTLWLSQLSGRPRRGIGRRLAWAVVCYTLVVAVGMSARAYLQERWWPLRSIHSRLSHESPTRLRVEVAAAYLERLTTPEMPVPICVWGDWAELYWRTPRPSVSKCIAPYFFDEIHPRVFNEWVEAMLAQRPPLVVTDGTMLGPTSESSRHLRTPGFPRLKEMLDQDYVTIRRIDDLCFLALKGGPFDRREGETDSSRPDRPHEGRAIE